MSFEPAIPAPGRALTIIRPYPEMDVQIVSLLQESGDPMKEYAAARIAKLEGDLAAIRIRELEAQVNALDGTNPDEIKELVAAVDRTVSVWQYEPCHAKALALERVMGDLQDALAKVKKED